MTASVAWTKSFLCAAVCFAIAACTSPDSPNVQQGKVTEVPAKSSTNDLSNATESINDTAWCVGHRPVFKASASSDAVQVTLEEPPREGQWTCACAINTLVATRMKEIACSRGNAVRMSPFCRGVSDGATGIHIGRLTTDTNYTVCVRYLCSGENSSEVTCHAATTEAAVRSEPQFAVFVSANASQKSANVTWTTTGPANGHFSVTLWKVPLHRAGTHLPIDTVTSNVSWCAFTSLEPYTLYKAEVSAIGSSSVMADNATVFRTLPDEPSPPQNFRLVSSSSTAMTLQWSAPREPRGPLSGYAVFYGPAWEHQKRSSMETHNTSVTVTHLTPATEFEVYVKAFNKLPNGTALASSPTRIEVKTAIGAPSKIQNLRVVSRSKNSVVVSWTAPQKANGPLDGYVVHWCNHSKASNDIASLAAITNHSECHSLHPAKETRANVSPLSPESTYVVAVSAFNLKADRHNRFESSPETIVVETLPEAPPALRDLDVRMVSADSVEVNWEAPSAGVEGYVVAWCQNHRCSEKTVPYTRLVIHNLHADSDYNVSVVPFRTDSQGNKVAGPLTTRLVNVSDDIDSDLANGYLVGTVVCSVIIAVLGLGVFVFCRRKKGRGPQLYKRMSSLDNDDDDIVFMKTVPRRT
uniref:Putative cell adhesion molecule ixodes scapularis cell adhesion molecule n=1 Tax=Amblyomma triste TaxID=251400 RepID=A0A023G3H4_AMBTT